MRWNDRAGRLALPLAAFLVTTSASSARADEALPVYVSFEFRAKPVANLYDDAGRAAAVAKVANDLAERCASGPPGSPARAGLGPWRFVGGGPSAYPRIEVRLTKVSGEFRLEGWLIETAKAPEDQVFNHAVFKPGDLDAHGMPSAKNWPRKVIEAFEEMLEAKGNDLRAALRKKAPIGAAVFQLAKSPTSVEQAQAVLPLDFERYRSLATSWFAIVVVVPSGPDRLARIHSAGTGSAAQYPGRAFRGITVQYAKWEYPRDSTPQEIKDVLASLDSIDPKFVYLEREDSLGAAILADPPRR
jgi:hypothetical protein